MRPGVERRPRPTGSRTWVFGLWLALVPLTSLRAQVPAAAPAARAPGAPTLRIAVSADTILLPPAERLPIRVGPGPWASVVASLAPEGADGRVVWRSDTLAGAAAAQLAWDLRGGDGLALTAGRYRLRVTAVDSGGAAASAERLLDIERLPADTVLLPPPPRAREILPETVMVHQTTPWAIFIGAAAGLIPQLIGRGELNDNRSGDTKGWLVGASVTAAGFVAFFAGRRAVFSAENAAHNAQFRDDYRHRLAAAQGANAEARARAGYRIRAEAAAP